MAWNSNKKMQIREMKQQLTKIDEKIDSFLKSGNRRIGDSSATITKA